MKLPMFFSQFEVTKCEKKNSQLQVNLCDVSTTVPLKKKENRQNIFVQPTNKFSLKQSPQIKVAHREHHQINVFFSKFFLC